MTKTLGGGATVNLISGPVPTSASISGGGAQNFVYTFEGTAAGTVRFSGFATGTEINLGTAVSSALALLFAVPLSIGTALFLVRIAPHWMIGPVSVPQSTK